MASVIRVVLLGFWKKTVGSLIMRRLERRRRHLQSVLSPVERNSHGRKNLAFLEKNKTDSMTSSGSTSRYRVGEQGYQ
jgi:hypothetical protein